MHKEGCEHVVELDQSRQDLAMIRETIEEAGGSL
jgi:hypothetical protein